MKKNDLLTANKQSNKQTNNVIFICEDLSLRRQSGRIDEWNVMHGSLCGIKGGDKYRRETECCYM